MLPEKDNHLPALLHKNQYLPWVMAIVTAIFAAFILPRHTTFSYRYEVDKIWTYNDLYAPIDFFYFAQDKQVNAAKSQPCYQYRPEVASNQKSKFNDLLQEQIRVSKSNAEYDDLLAHAGSYRTYGLKLLDHLYRTGIIDIEPAGIATVTVLGPTVRTIPLSELVTVPEALEVITDSLPFSPLRQPELILPLLERVLTPNLFYADSVQQAGSSGFSVGSKNVTKGSLIVRKGEKIDPNTFAQLNTLQRAFRYENVIAIWLGYFIFCAITLLSLTGWLHFNQPEALQHLKQLAQLLLIILSVLLLITICNTLGHAVPLLLPLYLIPLIMQSRYGQQTAIIIWSIPVILSGFALEWGMLWVCIQAVGAGVGMLLNAQVSGWRDRIQALFIIFFVQTLVWLAAMLAEKVPDTIQTTDTIVFIAIASLLSISRSVLVRFFNMMGE